MPRRARYSPCDEAWKKGRAVPLLKVTVTPMLPQVFRRDTPLTERLVVINKYPPAEVARAFLIVAGLATGLLVLWPNPGGRVPALHRRFARNRD